MSRQSPATCNSNKVSLILLAALRNEKSLKCFICCNFLSTARYIFDVIKWCSLVRLFLQVSSLLLALVMGVVV